MSTPAAVPPAPRPRVFIAADPGHDYRGAHAFGTLTRLLEGRPNVFAPERLARQLVRGLAGAAPGDFLLVTGSSTATALAFAALLARHGRVNLLIWSYHDEAYIHRIVDRGMLEPKGGA